MTNNQSSPIVRQESEIEQTSLEVEVLPNNSASSPPDQSQLGSHFNDLSWRNGAQILADAADFIPGLGSSIKAVVGLGEHSPDERLKDKQFKWVVEEILKISNKLDTLIKKEEIEAADVASIINAAIKVSEKTADAKKRKLLKNAVVNSFDVHQYQEGLNLRLFSILENLVYGDVELLRTVAEKIGNNPQKKSDINNIIDKPKNSGDLRYHHLEILRKQGLILIQSSSSNSTEVIYADYVIISELGEKFLEFVKEAES